MSSADVSTGSAHVTVAIPTIGRAGPLRRLLAALATQDDPGVDWDLLIVVNGPMAEGGPTAEAVAASVGRPTRVVHEPVPGASSARNRALAEVGGVDGRAVVAFVDDDVTPEPGWLRALVAPVLAGAAAAAGPVRLDPAVPRPRWFSGALAGYLSDFDLGPATGDVVPPAFVITANAAFTAGALRRAGGFAPALGPRPGSQITNEDVLLSWRLAANGDPVRWVPGAVVVHDLPPERLALRYVLHRTWSQGRSDRRLDVELGRPRGSGAAMARRLRHELGTRVREGPWRPAVALLAVCDVARAAGYAREAAGRTRRHP